MKDSFSILGDTYMCLLWCHMYRVYIPRRKCIDHILHPSILGYTCNMDGKCQCPVDKKGDSLGWSGLECKVSNDEVSFPCIYGGTLESHKISGYCPSPPCPYPCNKGEGHEQPYNNCKNGNNGGGGWHCVNVTKGLPCRGNKSQIWFQKGENCFGTDNVDYNISPASIPGKLHGLCSPITDTPPICESGLECIAFSPEGSLCGPGAECGRCREKT